MPEMIPFADGSVARLRAGDTVFIDAAEEEWLVLADTGVMVAWAGWPPGMLNRADCRPMKRCGDTEHLKLLAAIREGQHPLREIILRENPGPS